MIRAIQFPDNIQNIVYRIEFYLRHPNFSNYLLYRIIRACNPIGSKTSALCSVERSLQLSLHVHRGVIFLNKQARRKTSRRNLSIAWGGPLLLCLIRRNNVDPGRNSVGRKPVEENRGSIFQFRWRASMAPIRSPRAPPDAPFNRL